MLPNPRVTRHQVELMQIDNVSSPGMPGFGELGIRCTQSRKYFRRCYRCPRGIGMTLAADVDSLLRDFSVPRDRYSHGSRTVRSPLTGDIIANLQDTSSDSVTEAIARAKSAFVEWRSIPRHGAAISSELLVMKWAAPRPRLARMVKKLKLQERWAVAGKRRNL